MLFLKPEDFLVFKKLSANYLPWKILGRPNFDVNQPASKKCTMTSVECTMTSDKRTMMSDERTMTSGKCTMMSDEHAALRKAESERNALRGK